VIDPLKASCPLGRRDLRQRDVEACSPIASLGPDYIRPLHSPKASTCFHFHSVLGFRRRSMLRESSSATKLRSATAATSHANQVPSAIQIQIRWL
jgi:hypothetical protein